MTVKEYHPVDLKKQLADRRLLRIAMVNRQPRTLSFSEGTVDLAGKDILYILERPYDQSVDALIGCALETTARKYRKTWKEMILTTKYNDEEFRAYNRELTQRIRKMCEEEFSHTADVVVPGSRALIVCAEKGCIYQTTPITEETKKRDVTKLLREKGLEGAIKFV